jgi:hypothetical protein
MQKLVIGNNLFKARIFGFVNGTLFKIITAVFNSIVDVLAALFHAIAIAGRITNVGAHFFYQCL